MTAGRGLYDAVRYTATLPFVDVNRIGVVGYSRGARACGECMVLDNAAANSLGKRLISTMHLIHSNPVYKDNGIYCDVYGSRDIGVNADKYDEFSYSEKAEVSGTTYNAEANRYAVSSTTPVDYIINPQAPSLSCISDRIPQQLPKNASRRLCMRKIFLANKARESPMSRTRRICAHGSLPFPCGTQSGFLLGSCRPIRKFPQTA